MICSPSPRGKLVLAAACCVFAATLLWLLVAPAAAVAAQPFERGSVRGSLFAGSGRSFDQQYFLVGLGAGYYVVEGLELGLDAEGWFGNDPGIYRLSPAVRYVLPLTGQWRPYLGSYYRYTLVEDQDDYSSVGARAGVMTSGGGNLHFGAGLVYDVLLDCDEDLHESCTQLYPEVQLLFHF